MELILHIGQQKTGSTALQTFLNEKYAILRGRKILYPQSLGNEHNKQHLIMHSFKTQSLNEENGIKADFLAEISKTTPKKVIISDENMFVGKPENLNQLKVFVNDIFHKVKIICYLRVQHDQMPSNYQQGLKGKLSKDLRSWLDTHIYKSVYYKYHIVLNRWKNTFPEAKILVKTVGNLLHDDIVQDFVEAVIPEVKNEIIFESKTISNRSIDQPSGHLLYFLNKLIDKSKHPSPFQSIKESVISDSSNYTTKTPFAFSNEEKLEIWNQFKDRNTLIASDFKLSQADINYLTSPPEMKEDDQIDNLERVYLKFLEYLEKRK
ncbi:MAG: hypothetical protein HKO66_13855 [Saprospiraceae bacterium]|nr:hypothetical protein [Bacteroidia bacterium]NNL93320.1 hypothetical protein [Saprospiraceae bacterium]